MNKLCQVSRFDWQYIGQIYGGDFAKFCALLRILKNRVKNIQTAAYNGTRTVFEFGTWFSPSQALL